MRNYLVLGVMVLLLMAACGGPAAVKNETANVTKDTVDTVKDAVAPDNTTAPGKTAPIEQKVILNEKPMGAMVVAIKIKNADALENFQSLNLTFRRVELELGNKSGSFIPVTTTKTYPNIKALGDDSFELGLGEVPAQEYKSVRLQLSTSGDAFSDRLISYSVPYEYLQVSKSFTVEKDARLLLIFEIDLAKSANDANGTVILKPQGTITLLSGADTARKGNGLLTVTGGKEVFSVAKTFEELLPAGTLQKVIDGCKKKCPDSCLTQSDSCKTTCINEVTEGCSLGGTDCRERCDPLIFPVYCRDNCDLSSSECSANLIGLCKEQCENKNTAPCVSRCEAACS
jgi:hypothetical protein